MPVKSSSKKSAAVMAKKDSGNRTSSRNKNARSKSANPNKMELVSSSAEGISTVSRPLLEDQGLSGQSVLGSRALLGDVLVKMKVITKEKLAEALTRLPSQKMRLGEYLVSKNLVKDIDVQIALSGIIGIPFQKKLNIELPHEILTRLPIRFIKNNLIVPVKENGRELDVAIYDPFMLQPLDDIRMIFPEYRIHAVVSTKKQIEGAISHFFEKTSAGAESMLDGLESTDMNLLSNKVEETRDLMEQDSGSPIIQLVDAMISGAATERASDIHIEPFEKDLIVRYRVDGILYEILKPPQKIQSAIISRVKVMAKLNIAETRLPQDGRIQLKIGEKDLDIRISVLPTYWGERVVMRLLNKTNVKFSLETLGFEESVLKKFRRQMQRTTGVVLVTGPTGSGKSTTLYGSLSELKSTEKNIMTIEDPVEYQIQGINQMHVRTQIDLTFARGLRAILRQDPDIIMVGEIRDAETAKVAVQASLTGHLVLSTLHTNDAVSSVVRLVDMGIEPYLVNSSVTAFFAQRLVRVICPRCKTTYKPDTKELKKMDLTHADLIDGKLFYGKGCANCKNTGFLGRIMICELLEMNEEIMELLAGKASNSLLQQAAIKNGMRPMKEDAVIKVVNGFTTIDEVLRVSV